MRIRKVIRGKGAEPPGTGVGRDRSGVEREGNVVRLNTKAFVFSSNGCYSSLVHLTVNGTWVPTQIS